MLKRKKQDSNIKKKHTCNNARKPTNSIKSNYVIYNLVRVSNTMQKFKQT